MTDPRGRLALTILAVEDVVRSARFYAEAFGWRQTVDASPWYAEFVLPGGGTGLGLYRRQDFAATSGGDVVPVGAGRVAPAELYVRVDELDGAIAALVAAGARPLSPRALRNWGDEAAYFADPDGNIVAVSRPADDDDEPPAAG